MAATLKDNSAEILRHLQTRSEMVLTAIAAAAQGYARNLCPVDTGHLRQSISYVVQDKTAYIGTNVSYAPFVEFGTGPKCTLGGGTLIVETKNGPKSFAGQRPQPYLKPAIADHLTEYRDYIEKHL